MGLIDNLVKEGWLKTPRIIEAFQKIKRADFLPDNLKDSAELDEALSIGYGQTISQPLVVAFMLELLWPEAGNKILDIGSGSGWTSALLAELVGEKGRVIAIDIIPELVEFAKSNITKYGFVEKGVAEFICADASKGYGKETPYDRILASASAKGEIPNIWKKQLKAGGRIVAPVGSSIWQISKTEGEARRRNFFFSTSAEASVFEEIEYPGFIFVPLIEGR